MAIKKATFLYVIVCLILLWGIGLFWFGHTINTYKQDNETYTDAIIVLTGGRNRIAEGIKILNKGLAGKLFISGVPQKINMEDIGHVLNISVSEEDNIELGHNARNTIENAEEIKKWISENDVKSLRFITSNYHIPRSLAEFSAYNLPLKIIVHPVYSEKVARYWWQSWGTFKLIASEYNKYIFVCLRNVFYTIKGGK